MAQKTVTKEIYDKIKAVVKEPKDDKAAMKQFGFGKTVIGTIRRTKDYQEYCERCFRFHGHPKSRTQSRVKAIVEKDGQDTAKQDKSPATAPETANAGKKHKGFVSIPVFSVLPSCGRVRVYHRAGAEEINGIKMAEKTEKAEGVTSDEELDTLIHDLKAADATRCGHTPQIYINIEHVSEFYAAA